MNHFPGQLISVTGAFRRQLEIVDQPEWICSIPVADLESYFTAEAIYHSRNPQPKRIVFPAMKIFAAILTVFPAIILFCAF